MAGLYAGKFTTAEIPKGSPLWQGVWGDSPQVGRCPKGRGDGAISQRPPLKLWIVYIHYITFQKPMQVYLKIFLQLSRSCDIIITRHEK